MSKTVEELAKEYVIEKYFKYLKREEDDNYELLVQDFIAGYQAAKDQLADTNKVTTADYVETASNDAKELIAKYELEGDKDILIKALVAAYCSGVDAVDGYLRNSLSAYRNSVKRLQWISVKERLPEDGQDVIFYVDWVDKWDKGSERITYQEIGKFDGKNRFDHRAHTELDRVTHWMPLIKPPEEK